MIVYVSLITYLKWTCERSCMSEHVENYGNLLFFWDPVFNSKITDERLTGMSMLLGVPLVLGSWMSPHVMLGSGS